MKKYGITISSEIMWLALYFCVVFLIYQHASLTFVFFATLFLYTMSTIMYLLVEIGLQKLSQKYTQRKSK